MNDGLIKLIIENLPIVYLTVVSLVSVVVCICDKCWAKIPGHRRVPEAHLIYLSVLGGSVAMLITMLIIHHKTRKKKFMLGIPAIIILQYVVFWFIAVKLFQI